jgi:phosphoribosylformylglycinamidine synthase
LDLARERALQELVVNLAEERLIRSAHDCSDGGIAVTLAECCFGGHGVGADVAIDSVSVLPGAALNAAAALFGESASRIVVSVAADETARVLERAAALRVPARLIGETGGNRLRISVAGRVAIDLAIGEAERAWSGAIDAHFGKKIA